MNDPIRRTSKSRNSRRRYVNAGRSVFSILSGAVSRRSGADARRSRFVEPLEDRRLLSVTTAYVAHAADYTDTSNPGNNGNPQPGDTVTWNGGGQFTTPVTGLIFGTDAFTSINTAAANVSMGGAVDVAPGTYSENVTIGSQLSLIGAGNGNNAAADTIIDAGGGAGITIAASGTSAADADRLKIENLQVQNGLNGIIIDSAVSFVTIDNLTTTGNSNAGIEIHNNAVVNDLVLNNVSATNNQVGFRVATTGSVDGLTITNSHFDGNTEGLYTNGASGSTTNQNNFTNISVSNTTFNNNTLKGIYAEKLDHATFDGITVDQSGTSGASSAGIDINLKYGNYSDITIKNSSITNSGTGDTTTGVGVTFKSRADGGYAANPATLTGVTLTNNIITGNQNGIRAGESDDLTNNPTQVVINDNNLSGNLGVALDNETPDVIDASLNWWGTNVAANIAGMLSGTAVDFTPYLDSGNNSAAGAGFQGDLSVLDVTSLGGQVGAIGRIQQAVNDAVSGGTVNVGAGTYDEGSISLNKPITLDGPNAGINPNTGTRVAEAILNGTGVPANGNFIYVQADNVTINGFTVEGSSPGAGIVTGNSGGQILDNIITNNEIGIYADSTGPTLIQGNLITGNNVAGPAGGTAIYSDATNGLTINNNVINNQTINSAITFAASAANVHKNLTVSNNSIAINAPGNSAIYVVAVDGGVFSGNDITANGGGSGIHLAGDDTNISIHNNNFVNNTNGVSVTDDGYGFGANAGLTVNYNRFIGNTTGLNVDSGANVYSDAKLDASKNWWNDVSGPTIASNVGGAGQAIAAPAGLVSYAPWLIYGTNAAPAGTPGFLLPAIVPVTSQGDVSAAVNDFTLLQNAIGAAATGQTIDLSGPFNWTETKAAAAYAASTNTAPTADIRGVALPDGVNNLTITSSAQNATITGLGDSTDGIYNSFLFSAVNPSTPTDLGNNNLTVSNLNLDNFKSGIMLGWNSYGTFDGTLVKNNTITVAADNDNNANDTQGIAVYFTAGQNQTMTGNTIEFMGNGTRTTGSGARSYGFQNSTTGGTGYNGLSIDHNVFKLLPSAVGGAEVVTGIWENGHNDDNNSHISIADNQFLGIQGQRKFDIALQLSSQTTNMAIDGNTFTDVKYVYWVGEHNGDASGDQFTFTNNTLTRVGDANGVFLQNVASDAAPPYTITINWGTNNTIDGFTGIRGLNELSTQATGTSRPNGAATDLNAVVAFGPIQVDYVNASWGAQARFTNPLAAPDGTPGPIAFGFNTFSTIQAGVDGINTTPGTVNVLPGTYAENVTINKNLTLIGTGAAPGDVVIAPTAGDGITIAAPATDVTVKNLEVTGAAGNGISANGVATVTLNNLLLDGNNVGFSASGLTTLNLSDLTLTGNASAGGTIAGATTVNDTPITGATGATDIITGSTIQRGSDNVVNYTGVSNLNITGSAGADTFNVTPATSTIISINGGLPTPPTTPGDTLTVDTSGTTTPALNYVSAPSGFQGSFTFGNRDALNFQGIESLTGVANLTITKIDNSATPGLAVPGTPLTYTIVVANNGPSTANGAVVTDNLPAGFIATGYTSVASAGVVDTNPSGSGNISDTITTLPVGGSVTYTVTGKVASSATGTLTNVATASLSSPIPQTVTATDAAALTPQADLSITKNDNSPTPGQVLAGAPLTYTIVVTNNGPSDVSGAAVLDTLPAYFTGGNYTATATGGATGYTASGNGNIFDTVDLPAGSTITYVVTGTVSPTAAGNLTNTALVVAPPGVVDTNPSNNHATDTNVVSVQTDLRITKTDNSATPGSAIPGTSLTYTIVVTNAGASPANGAKVTDTLPANFTGASYTAVATGGATGYTASGNGNLNDTVNLPAGATITYTLSGSIKSSATGNLSNTATVTAPANVIDTNPANNISTDINSLVAQTHVSVTKSDNKGGDSATNASGSVAAGTAITYTIVVSNSGPSDATGVKIADALAAQFTNATYTATALGGATGFTASGNGNINDTVVNLPAGSSVTYVVTGTVASSASGTLSNTANLTLPAGLANTGDLTATDTDAITAEADLSIAKSDSRGGSSATNATGSVVAGTSMTYTIVVRNAGPSDVTGATVADALPAGFTATSSTPLLNGGAAITASNGSGGNINDTVNLPAGGSIVYVVSGTVSATASGSLVNTATISAPAGVVDGNTANNTATDTDNITAQSNLSITKKDDKGGDSATNATGSVAAGTAITYTIVVSNSGPSSVTGAQLTEPYPAGLVVTSKSSSLLGGASITNSLLIQGSGGFQDTLNLPSGSAVIYVISGTVQASTAGTLSNTATLAAGATTLRATDADTVTTQADVTITKTDSGGGNSATAAQGNVAAGSSLTYTVVVSNHGPSNVVGATIADNLPANFTGASFTASATGGATGFSATGSGSIDDTLVNLPVGSSITYVVTGTVAGAATGTLTNTASITLPSGAVNTGNASASVSDQVAAKVSAGIGYLAGAPGDATPQTFVQNLYRELLGREPDVAGEQFWTAQVQQNNTAIGRQAVIAGFMNSQEYKDHYITTLYEVFLGRAPEAAGLQYWTAKMGDPGTAGGHNGDADEKLVLAAIVGSDEFYVKNTPNPASQSPINPAVAWVDALYRDLLGREADANGEAFWVQQVEQHPQNRDGIVQMFLSSPEAMHKLLDSFYPAPGGTSGHPLPQPGQGVPADSYDLAIVTGLGWENLYLEGPYNSSPQGNDAFFDQLASGASWDDVQFGLLTSAQFYDNPNRPVTA